MRNIIRKVFNKTTIIWRLITYFVVPKWRLTQTSESVNIYHRHRKIKNKHSSVSVYILLFCSNAAILMILSVKLHSPYLMVFLITPEGDFSRSIVAQWMET